MKYTVRGYGDILLQLCSHQHDFLACLKCLHLKPLQQTRILELDIVAGKEFFHFGRDKLLVTTFHVFLFRGFSCELLPPIELVALHLS